MDQVLAVSMSCALVCDCPWYTSILSLLGYCGRHVTGLSIYSVVSRHFPSFLSILIWGFILSSSLFGLSSEIVSPPCGVRHSFSSHLVLRTPTSRQGPNPSHYLATTDPSHSCFSCMATEVPSCSCSLLFMTSVSLLSKEQVEWPFKI